MAAGLLEREALWPRTAISKSVFRAVSSRVAYADDHATISGDDLRPHEPSTLSAIWLVLTADPPDTPVVLELTLYSTSGKPQSGEFSIPARRSTEPWPIPPLPHLGDPAWDVRPLPEFVTRIEKAARKRR